MIYNALLVSHTNLFRESTPDTPWPRGVAIMKLVSTCSLLALFAFVASAIAAGNEPEEGFVSLFDGKSFDGWKVNENPDSWKIVEGAMVCRGPRSHVFYVGDQAPFKNFHFKCDVMTKPKANAGIYFHTKYQDSGWPKFGYEAQVNATHGDPKKTGSLYDVKNVAEANHQDNEWYTEEIIVEGKRIQIIVNGKTVVDFTEEPDRKAGRDFTRILDADGGTFAFQSHDPESEVHFRNVRVKKLPD